MGAILSSASSKISTGFFLRRSSTRVRAPYTMRSATDFLPLTMTWFMNLARVTLPNLGSGSTSRLAATRLLGMLLHSSLQGYPGTGGSSPARPYSVLTETANQLLAAFGRLAPYLERR